MTKLIHRLTGPLLAGALAVSLTACGFTPLYGVQEGTSSRTEQELAQIEIMQISDDRLGYDVYNALVDRLSPTGLPANPDYQLRVRLREDREGVAIERDASITRYNYRLNATYALIDVRSGNVIHEGTSRSIAAYNVVDNQFATLSAQRDAQERAAVELSEDIRLRLGIFFGRQINTAPGQ